MSKTRSNKRVKKTMQKSKKSRNTRNYVIFEKYKKNIFGVDIFIYKLKFNTNYKCGHYLTLKKKTDYIKKSVVKNIHLLDFLTKNKVFSKKIYKYDKNITEKIISLMNAKEKYTFCLNKNTLVFAETKTIENNSLVKEWMTKHIMLCDENACASGEMIIHNKSFVFNNSSGTFQPSLHDLYSIKKALPFMDIKITSRESKTFEFF